MLDFAFKCTFLHPYSKKPMFIISDVPHLSKKLVNSLELSSDNKSERNLMHRGCPLNLKTIVDVWRATRASNFHLLIDTLLAEKYSTKMAFLE